MLTTDITFKPLQESDLDLLVNWFSMPHVKKWWDDQLSIDEIKIKYRNRIGDQTIVPFIVYLNTKPIGFIQYYHANKIGAGWWADAKPGTIGIDQFIGEADYINRGIGTKMILEFIKLLFADPNIKLIITDVSPDNHRAIRAYEKSGFRFVKELITPEGLAYLMEIRRSK